MLQSPQFIASSPTVPSPETERLANCRLPADGGDSLVPQLTFQWGGLWQLQTQLPC